MRLQVGIASKQMVMEDTWFGYNAEAGGLRNTKPIKFNNSSKRKKRNEP